MQVYNDELYHFGIKGMRWGHRNSTGTKTISKRKQHNQDILDARKNLKSASDDLNAKRQKFSDSEGKKYQKEFRDAELRYSKLSTLANQRTSGEKAKKIVGTTLGMIGALTLTGLASAKIK